LKVSAAILNFTFVKHILCGEIIPIYELKRE